MSDKVVKYGFVLDMKSDGAKKALRDLEGITRRYNDALGVSSKKMKDFGESTKKAATNTAYYDSHIKTASRSTKELSNSTQAATQQTRLFSKSLEAVGKASVVYYLAKRMAGFAYETAQASEAVYLLDKRMTTLTSDAKALGKVVAMSKELGVSFEDLGQNVGRFAISTKGAFTTDEILKWQKALILSGKAVGLSVQEGAAAVRQLNQSLSKGKLDGDELRSVMENLPLLAKELHKYADEAGKSIFDMGKNGELTQDVLVSMFEKLADSTGNLGEDLTKTLSSETARLANSWKLMLDAMSEDNDGFIKTFIRNMTSAVDAVTEFAAAGGKIAIAEAFTESLELEKKIADARKQVDDALAKRRNIKDPSSFFGGREYDRQTNVIDGTNEALRRLGKRYEEVKGKLEVFNRAKEKANELAGIAEKTRESEAISKYNKQLSDKNVLLDSFIAKGSKALAIEIEYDKMLEQAWDTLDGTAVRYEKVIKAIETLEKAKKDALASLQKPEKNSSNPFSEENIDNLKLESSEKFYEHEAEVHSKWLKEKAKKEEDFTAMIEAVKLDSNERVFAAGLKNGKAQKEQNDNLATANTLYGAMASSMRGLFEEGSTGAKAMMVTQQALSMVNAVNAILTQGQGDPYSSPIRMAAMAATVAGYLSQIGQTISGGGGQVSATPQSTAGDLQSSGEFGDVFGAIDSSRSLEDAIDELTNSIEIQTKIYEKTGDFSTSITEAFDLGKIELIEGIEKSFIDLYGRNFQTDLSDTNFAIDLATKSIATFFDSGSLTDPTRANLAGTESDTFSSWHGKGAKYVAEFESIMDMFSALADIEQAFNYDLEQLSAGDKGQVLDLQAAARDAYKDYLEGIYDLYDDISGYQDQWIEYFEEITGNNTYTQAKIDKAFDDIKDLQKSLGIAGASITKTFEVLIDAVDIDFEEIKRKYDEVGIGAEFTNYLENALKVNGLPSDAVDGQVETILKYIGAIDLVGEAMVESTNNINEWTQRNETLNETADRLAITLGADLAKNTDELDELFLKLAYDVEGLTDAELELLDANEKLIQSIDDELEEVTNDLTSEINELISSFDIAVDSIKSLRESIQQDIHSINGTYTSESALRALLTGAAEDVQIYSQIQQLIVSEHQIRLDNINEEKALQESVFSEMKSSLESLSDYVSNMLLSDISPLTGSARLNAAQSYYNTDLLKAQAGDAGAVGNLSGSADAYLQAKLGQATTSQEYNAIFWQVNSALKGILDGKADYTDYEYDDSVLQEKILEANRETTEKLNSLDVEVINLQESLTNDFTSQTNALLAQMDGDTSELVSAIHSSITNAASSLRDVVQAAPSSTVTNAVNTATAITPVHSTPTVSQKQTVVMDDDYWKAWYKTNYGIDVIDYTLDFLDKLGSSKTMIFMDENHMNGVTVPGFADGTNQVSNDGFAFLHKDEAIVPKQFNPAYKEPESNKKVVERLEKVEALLVTIAKNSNKQTKIVQKHDIDGLPPERAAA